MSSCDHTNRQYRRRQPQDSDLYKLLQDHLETFLTVYDEQYLPRYGYLRPEVRIALEELIRCGVYRFGLARVVCRDCGDEDIIPLSCQRRGLCSSCHVAWHWIPVFHDGAITSGKGPSPKASDRGKKPSEVPPKATKEAPATSVKKTPKRRRKTKGRRKAVVGPLSGIGVPNDGFW